MAHIFFRFLFNYYVLQLAFFSLTLVGGRHVTALQLFFFWAILSQIKPT